MRKLPRFYLKEFLLGWYNSEPSMALDPRMLYDCKNLILTPQKTVEKRKGMSKLYPTTAGTSKTVKTLHEYKAPNGTDYLLVAIDTKIRAYYTSVWNDLKTGLTADQKYSFVNHGNFCYGVNGTDANFKLYNVTAQNVGIAPPGSKPTVAIGALTGLTGRYRYYYAYKRETPVAHIGNPSPLSDEISPSNQSVQVSYTESADTQVTKIVIYRTLDLDSGGNTSQLYKVTEVANATSNYDDNTSDNNLTTLCDIDNYVPPKAKFVVKHQDRVVYGYLSAETNGKYGICWSKVGNGESIPAANYQYFDRHDGEELTGIASFQDFLVIFKRNKFAILSGNLSDPASVVLTVKSYGIGNIAPWAILALDEKLIFLSEEGWKAFDGANLYDLSQNIGGLLKDGYASFNQAANYSVAYTPIFKHFRFLMNHSTLPPMITVGHFLVPLIYVASGIPEQKSENLVSWTYHQYDNHTLSVLGTITDANGITQIVAGDTGGFVYQLDSGSSDDGSDIHYIFSSAWLDLGEFESNEKTVRRAVIAYITDQLGSFNVNLDVDFTPGVETMTLYGTDTAYCGYCYSGYAYSGVDGSLIDELNLKSTGHVFRYTITGTNQQNFQLMSIITHYRNEGLR